jgi:hypothetical protein
MSTAPCGSSPLSLALQPIMPAAYGGCRLPLPGLPTLGTLLGSYCGAVASMALPSEVD